MIKSLRKSLNSHKDPPPNIATPPLPPLSKPSSAILPPKKVIKAIQSYRATSPQQLSFEKGDFFHVLNDVNNQGVWYEAHNPMTGARGLVPCQMFEVFQKGLPTPRTPTFPDGPAVRPLSSTSAKPQAFYAVVLHDFVAERADELDAKAGDSITVVAQSNREWFVAKPIGRLGRPGLIPVSFVEVRDPTTGRPVADIMALIDGGALPRVEEWKRAMMNYKANSISLGVLEDSAAANGAKPPVPVTKHDPTIEYEGPPASAPLPPPNAPNSELECPPSPKLLPEGILLSADIKSFHYEMDEYWFRVHAIFQPYDPAGSTRLPPARQLVLFRSYNDFYDFQIELLQTFPAEGGNPDVNARILPYMPGPVDHVDNEVTDRRRGELDDYLHKLCELQHYARYILEHTLIRSFLSIKPGDAEVEIEHRSKEIEALERMSYHTEPEDTLYEGEADYGAERLSQVHISEDHQDKLSDGSDYGERHELDVNDYGYPEEILDSPPVENGWNTTQPLRPRSRTTGERDTNGGAPYGHASHHSISALSQDPYYTNGVLRSSFTSHDPTQDLAQSARTSQPGSTRTSVSGRSRSQSNAAYTPPISANNPQIAFIKIKVFDQATGDIVALRVHPKITHSQLLQKASEKLKTSVDRLAYRDKSREPVYLEDDDHLDNWLGSTDKFVLFAG